MNGHCWIVTKVAPSNEALGVMSCVHLAQTCSHRILCFTCCREGRNAPRSSQVRGRKLGSPALPKPDLGELAICSTEVVQRVPRLIDLEGCDDISSAVGSCGQNNKTVYSWRFPRRWLAVPFIHPKVCCRTFCWQEEGDNSQTLERAPP